jgi:hypothetical protein
MKTMRNILGLRAGISLTLWTLMAIGIAGAAHAEEPVAPGSAFDRTFSATSPDRANEVGVAGKVVDRFTPPVAAPIDPGSPGQPLAQTLGPVLRPCDTPGSGCRNPQPISPQVGVPPIVPGTRPPRANP